MKQMVRLQLFVLCDVMKNQREHGAPPRLGFSFVAVAGHRGEIFRLPRLALRKRRAAV